MDSVDENRYLMISNYAPTTHNTSIARMSLMRGDVAVSTDQSQTDSYSVKCEPSCIILASDLDKSGKAILIYPQSMDYK